MDKCPSCGMECINLGYHLQFAHQEEVIAEITENDVVLTHDHPNWDHRYAYGPCTKE